MSGKPQFDEGAVVGAAIEVFWRHGYATASVSDLTDATGLSRSSIYQRFRDKDGLFLAALEAYTARVVRRMSAVEGPTARAQLVALLSSFLPDDAPPSRPAGCLIARSCTESLELSVLGRRAARAAVGRQREVIVNVIRRGVEAGELARDVDVEALSWHYFAALQGIVNLPHAGADRSALERMIDIAMTSWPASEPATAPLRKRR